MGAECVLLFGTAESDVRTHQQQRRTACFRARLFNRTLNIGDIVAIRHRARVPAVRTEALRDVFGEGQIGRAGE